MRDSSTRFEKRDARITFAVTPTEKQLIEQAIEKLGYRKASDFYRDVILEKVNQILELNS